MWDKISALIGSVVSLTRNVDDVQNDVAELQNTVKLLTERVTVLGFELQRQRDEATHKQKMAELERQNLLLRLEIALKQGKNELPPSLPNLLDSNIGDANKNDN